MGFFSLFFIEAFISFCFLTFFFYLLAVLNFQYLNKRNITTINREHFSFSCKVIVGEFILIKPTTDGSEKVCNLKVSFKVFFTNVTE